MRRRRAIGFLSLALVFVLAAWASGPWITSAAFVLDLAGQSGWPRRLLPVRAQSVATRDVSIPTRHGAIAGRVYEPEGRARHSILVVPGIHGGGVDEPRLETFARRLAGTGARVLSVPLPDLREFRVTPRSTDMIEDAAGWMAADRTLAPEGKISLGGVSFAGGLALVAAGRPSLAGKLRLVVSIGGHADLPRVMTYVCSGRLPGSGQPPHDYGVAVLLLGAAEHVVPAPQVEPLRRAVFHFLQAASYSASDPPASQRELEAARAVRESLSEPGRTYAGWAIDRNVAALGAVLLPWVDAMGGDPSLSPDRSPPPRVPVFLLHGADDRVIPTEETRFGAANLRARGVARVRALVTPLLTHADIVDTARPADVWALVAFWRDVLRTGSD
jgi:dienelactone hydrolase